MVTIPAIDIPDPIAIRIRAALGHWNTETPPIWVNATIGDVTSAIKRFLMGETTTYEKRIADAQAEQNANATLTF